MRKFPGFFPVSREFWEKGSPRLRAPQGSLYCGESGLNSSENRQRSPLSRGFRASLVPGNQATSQELPAR
jgi:hypothetical protein